MSYEEFVDRAIEEEKKRVTTLQKGEVDGLESCRNKSPKELKDLMKRATKTANHCAMIDDPEELYWRIRSAKISQMCNLVSAYLESVGQPVIVHPSANSVVRAARIMS